MSKLISGKWFGDLICSLTFHQTVQTFSNLKQMMVRSYTATLLKLLGRNGFKLSICLMDSSFEIID